MQHWHKYTTTLRFLDKDLCVALFAVFVSSFYFSRNFSYLWYTRVKCYNRGNQLIRTKEHAVTPMPFPLGSATTANSQHRPRQKITPLGIDRTFHESMTFRGTNILPERFTGLKKKQKKKQVPRQSRFFQGNPPSALFNGVYNTSCVWFNSFLFYFYVLLFIFSSWCFVMWPQVASYTSASTLNID